MSWGRAMCHQEHIQQPALSMTVLVRCFGTSGDCSSALVKHTEMLQGVLCVNSPFLSIGEHWKFLLMSSRDRPWEGCCPAL